LIALIINAHHATSPRQKEMTLCECHSASQDTIEKTSLLKHIRERCGQATPSDWSSDDRQLPEGDPKVLPVRPDMFPLHDVL